MKRILIDSDSGRSQTRVPLRRPRSVDCSSSTAHAEGKVRRRLLASWFKDSRRPFPWRQYQTSWAIFLAEMLLLRTRAKQVATHVDRILERYPSPGALAGQRLNVAENSLAPLGLHWRARSLYRSAQIIVSEHGGEVPLDLDSLLKLPGVGPYIAASTIAALTGKKVVLVDTNTVRVATRVKGLQIKGDSRRRLAVREAIACLLGGPASGTDWLAVLDLAASVCLPKLPRCGICPIRDHCVFSNPSLLARP
jgi:A/G-specific adenine glycosylase